MRKLFYIQHAFLQIPERRFCCGFWFVDGYEERMRFSKKLFYSELGHELPDYGKAVAERYNRIFGDGIDES